MSRMVGRNIRMVRRYRGMSLKEMARRMTLVGNQISHVNMFKIETGEGSRGYRRRVSVDEVYFAAVVLRVSMDVLMHPMDCPRCGGSQTQNDTCYVCVADLRTIPPPRGKKGSTA